METAVQQFITWYLEMNPDESDEVKEWFDKLLEIEKEEIITAYFVGSLGEHPSNTMNYPGHGEQYYKKTYETM